MTVARIHTLETTPEQHDEGLRIVTRELLPWYREAAGFRGMIRLADQNSGKVLVVSLWATEEDMHATAEAAKQFSSLTTASSGAELLSVEHYDVTLFDVET
jgi:heme-degrading monooxygenase HmoA